MKLTTMIKTAVAVVAIATIATITAPIAFAAYPITGKFGSELKMTDSVGQVVLGWTVSDLKSSSDVIPGYPVAGQVWEATATVNAISGPVTPAISQFNARTAAGVNYRVLWQASGPNTISGATIPQGASSTGKIYFDVTGPAPTIVAMNNGMEDLMIWGP
ncbi:MPT63 family protein [Mycobacterium marinum]|uniref:MPT63 family protein n=1 Tax=Mycobacterium marinum TaxID=1781 RepID=UPI002358DEF4|nr:MPT63 family protein [Mycobacterium marinum]MDC8983067.1 MPT63 family protein [Mycobacterium marinum]MDC9000139.1 MPT63 family protein [Mycobacterium marinum]MDC9010522.1 MPT63 family protein [Mycobacterium marinum]